MVEKFDFSAINSQLHHVGLTVSVVERSLLFWKDFLGVEPRFLKILDSLIGRFRTKSRKL